MTFEWHGIKAAANLQKHDVSFEEAATVFDDANALNAADLRHSAIERRFLRVGRSAIGSVLAIAYVLRSADSGETIRIISARRASRKERTAYFSAQETD